MAYIRTMKTHTQLLAAFPSNLGIAAATGVHPATVSTWRKRDRVPATHWIALVGHAAELGLVGITLEALAKAAEKHG